MTCPRCHGETWVHVERRIKGVSTASRCAGRQSNLAIANLFSHC